MSKRHLAFLILFFCAPCLHADSSRSPAYNGVSVDIPIDGGAMVSYNRTWMVTKFLDAGFVVSGGQIRRKFDLDANDGKTYSAEAESLVLPLAGPFVTLHWNWIGVSVGYDAFYSKTDLTVNDTPGGTLTGTTRGWGSVFYSPLLVFDIYDEKHNLVYGFGLGGYFGGNFKDLNASSSSYAITTNASPIETLTFHLRCLWADGHWRRATQVQEDPRLIN